MPWSGWSRWAPRGTSGSRRSVAVSRRRRDSPGRVAVTHTEPSREEALDSPPARRFQLVAEAVVEAAGAVLPELPGRRGEPEPSPRRRPRHRAFAESPLDFCEPFVQLGSRSERLALARGVRTDLRVARSRPEVRVRLLLGDLLDPALHPHLPAARRPVEEKRGPRVCLQLAAFPRGAVGVEDEAALV